MSFSTIIKKEREERGERERSPWVETSRGKGLGSRIFSSNIGSRSSSSDQCTTEPTARSGARVLFISRECMDYGPTTLRPSFSLGSTVTLRIHEYRVLSLSLALSPVFIFRFFSSPFKNHPACSFNFANRRVVFSRFSRTVDEILNPRSELLSRSLFSFSFSFLLSFPLPPKDQSSVRYARARRSARNCLKIVHERQSMLETMELRSDDKPISRAGCGTRWSSRSRMLSRKKNSRYAPSSSPLDQTNKRSTS